jgi:thiol-disulfide isomerase/thioredoxin
VTTLCKSGAIRALTSALCAVVLTFTAIPFVHGEETRPAPPCNLKQMETDEPYDLDQFRGKVLYVDFWASWCGPCVKSFPFLNKLDRDLKEQGLEVVGINLDENLEDASAFLARHPARFRIAVDPDKSCPRDFGVQGMPTSYLIDRQGMIRFVHPGFRPGEASQLRSIIEQLLNEPSTEL